MRTELEVTSMPGNQDGAVPAPDLDLHVERTAAATSPAFVAHGAAKPVSDPRRRRGGHSQARQLLGEDGRSFEPISQLWRGLASALQWHTLRAGLAGLRHEERQVLTMAYLEGRTNREIAAILLVSVSTVRRRLDNALAHLEDYLRRSGAWVSAAALLALSYAIRRTGVGRLTKVFGTGTSQTAALLTAAGAVGAITIGLVVISAGPAAQHPSQFRAVTGLTEHPTISGLSVPLTSRRPGAVHEHGASTPTSRASSTQVSQSTGQVDMNQLGCHGDPTSAQPTTPVATTGSHPTSAPVTHPATGGCGPHT